jgi:hypothetical protein
MIESFKEVAIKLQLEVFFYETEDDEDDQNADVSADHDASADYDVRDASTSVFDPLVPTVRIDENANSTFIDDIEPKVNSFLNKNQRVIKMPAFDQTLSTLSQNEKSRRYRR